MRFSCTILLSWRCSIHCCVCSPGTNTRLLVWNAIHIYVSRRNQVIIDEDVTVCWCLMMWWSPCCPAYTQTTSCRWWIEKSLWYKLELMIDTQLVLPLYVETKRIGRHSAPQPSRWKVLLDLEKKSVALYAVVSLRVLEPGVEKLSVVCGCRPTTQGVAVNYVAARCQCLYVLHGLKEKYWLNFSITKCT